MTGLRDPSTDVSDKLPCRSCCQVRSCNGVRVTERIMQLVPHYENFRTTLIAVKHWARVRHVLLLPSTGGVPI